ncbi:hypothetical protein [Dyadobacter luticola]|uniref:Uncharacterized protein n=1 Tax=Dyadobacter luticola TaxID=1979387 RepID=A0A5R9KZA4_9BACT|nr:hypothetical protein [Dyadobacter luticola]TLV01521.1 hypothetical protein FEN17_19035 [Dyadobacter luticola]
MTLYSLAVRVKEIIDLRTEYEETKDQQILLSLNDRSGDLNMLADSIISAYQIAGVGETHEVFVDVDEFGC